MNVPILMNNAGNDILSVHNQYRAVHRTAPLSRNSDLEASAQRWANKLASDCAFYHSGAALQYLTLQHVCCTNK